MRTTAALFVCLLLGVALAKPSLDVELRQLLKKLLDPKHEEDNEDRLATTIMDGTDVKPHRIFNKADLDITVALKEGDFDNVKKDIADTFQDLQTVLHDMKTEMQTFYGDKPSATRAEVAEFIEGTIMTELKEYTKKLWPLARDVLHTLFQGLIAGTDEGDGGEPACHKDGDDQGEAFVCVLNKGFNLMTALENAYEMAHTIIGDRTTYCTSMRDFFDNLGNNRQGQGAGDENNRQRPPGNENTRQEQGSGNGNFDVAAFALSVADTLDCFKSSMDEVKSDLGGAGENVARSQKILPRIISAATVMGFAEGHLFRAMLNFHMASGKLQGIPDKDRWESFDRKQLHSKRVMKPLGHHSMRNYYIT